MSQGYPWKSFNIPKLGKLLLLFSCTAIIEHEITAGQLQTLLKQVMKIQYTYKL